MTLSAIAPVEEVPVRVINPDGGSDLLLLCDHASLRIPDEYNCLGLEPEQSESHIAWDIGALAVARGLAQRLDAILIHPTISRLITDCNRAPEAGDIIVEISEGNVIPGNLNLSTIERERRLQYVHYPYHRQITKILDARVAAAIPISRILAIHSFTPVFNGVIRPWDAGILFEHSYDLTEMLLSRLAAMDLNVAANVPYEPLDGVHWTLGLHGDRRGLPNATIEIRNDLIRNEAGQKLWADWLTDIMSVQP